MTEQQALAVVDDKPKASLMKISDAPQGGGLALTSLAEVSSLGSMLAGAGYFKDVTSQAQAVVKILFGQEMGISPMAAMNGLYVFNGRVCMYADLINDKIKASGTVDFRVKKLTGEICILEWFDPRSGEILGESDFTLDQASIAGLTKKDTWKAYPKNMLFARALTFGMRLFARGVFAMHVFAVEEMIDEVSPTSQIIEGTIEPAKETKPKGAGKVVKKDAPPAEAKKEDPKGGEQTTASVAKTANASPTTAAAPTAQAESMESKSPTNATESDAPTEEDPEEDDDVIEAETVEEEDEPPMFKTAEEKKSSGFKWK